MLRVRFENESGIDWRLIRRDGRILMTWIFDTLPVIDVFGQRHLGGLFTGKWTDFPPFATGEIPFTVNIEETSAAEGHRT
jgi:hypothetical protein